MMKKYLLFAVCIWMYNTAFTQDTFSIVAVDPETGEVGSAGASCVDLSFFPGMDPHFLGELFPGVGAINTQAWYDETNQANARSRMNQGDTPQQIIDWLVANDVDNQPQLRQYGVVRLVDGMPQSAAHTGASTDDYKNHVLGENYAIQGNILLSQEVLDNMAEGFENAEGDLACKLMAAMQGANMVGADSRCTSNGTSSLFAFLKVASPEDTFGNPSFVVSAVTSDGDGIEPIDSLQTLFDAAHNCTVATTEVNTQPDWVNISPNPVVDQLNIDIQYSKTYTLQIRDMNGRILNNTTLHGSQIVDMHQYSSGVYIVTVKAADEVYSLKVVKP